MLGFSRVGISCCFFRGCMFLLVQAVCACVIHVFGIILNGF